MVVASTTEVLITAAFGLVGTLIGALIAGTVDDVAIEADLGF
jgi:hypothetical protein